MTERGQTFTLEAFVAAILLLATVAFALQSVAVSANTASAADTEIRREHAALAEGVLAQAVANGSLKETVLYWDASDQQFHDASSNEGYYIARAPPTTFGDSMRAMVADRRVRYNIDLYFPTADGDRGRQRLVEAGTPGDNAVRVVETVTLYNDTHLVNSDGSEGATLEDVAADGGSEFYAPDARSSSPVYTVIRVEVILWQS